MASRSSPDRRGARKERSEERRKLASVDGERGALRPRDLDRLIHQRTRLSIVSALAVADRLTFNDLKAALKTSDGNLSVHARKLEDAGYLQCTKSFAGRTPRTEYRLTPQGRAALRSYLEHMEALIDATRSRGGSPVVDP
ncbi:MAG TPA: transcriptional regulator [Gemmatimonadota bacterium]|nr:transcriptional regulator [Gemmatimonadota bacterium]